jgi:hypothetical protein
MIGAHGPHRGTLRSCRFAGEMSYGAGADAFGCADGLDCLDAVGFQDEHSHVDVAVRRRIGEIILEIENEELTETARRLVEQLPPEDVAQLVADWLDAQTAI